MDVIDFIILFLDGTIVIKSHGIDQDMKKSHSLNLKIIHEGHET